MSFNIPKRPLPLPPRDVVPAKPVNKTEDKKGIYFEQNRNVIAQVEQAAIHEATETIGGHGGFRLATVTVDGQTHEVFLKKYDPVEHQNYEIIQHSALTSGKNALLEFLPRSYGKVSIDGKEYLVLENLYRATTNGQSQIADVKLSAGGIASQEEMLATRNKEKKARTFARMQQESLESPGIMVAAHGPKFLRTLKYADSIKLLQANIASSKPPATPDQLEKLNKDLKRLQSALDTSPLGFIGASLFIFRDNATGDFRIYLGDPAHAIINNEQVAQNTPEITNMFIGTKEDVIKRIDQNKESIGVVIEVVTSVKVEKAAKKTGATALNEWQRTPSKQTKKLKSRVEDKVAGSEQKTGTQITRAVSRTKIFISPPKPSSIEDTGATPRALLRRHSTNGRITRVLKRTQSELSSITNRKESTPRSENTPDKTFTKVLSENENQKMNTITEKLIRLGKTFKSGNEPIKFKENPLADIDGQNTNPLYIPPE